MENTAKNTVIQLGSLIALYVSLSAILAIAFGVINIAFPDEVMGVWQYDSAQNGIRFGIAMLIVFFPTYLFLTRLVNQARRKETGFYLALTKWLVYLSLLVGGGILLGDLVAVIMTYLNGEITTRFILKALMLLFVIGLAFWYYILDARGYWNSHEDYSKLFGFGVTAFAFIVLIFGFYHTDSPQEVREMRLDEEQVMDLQNIQAHIEEHYRLEGALPITLEDAYGDLEVPEAPETRTPYRYQLLSSSSFELCATFAEDSETFGDGRYAPPTYEGAVIKNAYNWDHTDGEFCFERVVVQ